MAAEEGSLDDVLRAMATSIFDPETNETHVCGDGVTNPLTIQGDCATHEAVLNLLATEYELNGDDDGRVVGFYYYSPEGTNRVYESCGRFYAEEGFVDCWLLFNGYREIHRLGINYCKCWGQTTTGTIHNYPQPEGVGSTWDGYYHTISDGERAPTSTGKTCVDYILNRGVDYTATHGLFTYGTESECYAHPAEGAWGVNVLRERLASDSDEREVRFVRE